MPTADRRPAVGAVMLLCLTMLLVPLADAALWKWTDASGRTVYSDIPPTGDMKAERVNATPPPANPNAVKEMANQDAELKKRQMQRVEEAGKSDKARAEAARRQESCALSRGQLKSMQQQGGVALYRINEKGERVLMDETARRKESERLETYLREQCPA